jgi:hypothetical protein
MLAALLMIASPAAAQKIAEVVLMNGNTITGEVKELVQGKLRYKTDDMGTIYIEWEKIAQLSSQNFFEVETELGIYHYGALAPGPDERTLSVIDATKAVTLELDRVVRILPIKQTFWGRVDGGLNLGFSFTAADSILQYSLDANAAYRMPKYKASTKLSSIQTQQEDKDAIARTNLDFTYTRYHKNRYFGAGQLSFSRNTELGIDFRTQLGYSFGRNFRQTNRADLMGALGLAVNREKPIGEDPNDHYLSALISGRYNFFLYNFPKTNLLVDLVLMPDITDWPRFRVEFNASIMREIIADFTVNFTAYDSYDSDPPTDTEGVNHDYGVILSVGWTF